MNNWFLIALVAPLLWSVVSHIDKFMLSKYLKERGVGALLVFSALSSAILLPFVGFIYRKEIFSVSAVDFILLIFIGFLSAGAFYLYLAGMEEEEASIVVPLLQLVPVFGYVLGYLLLGESLSAIQLFASLIIILGIAILAIEIDADSGFGFKKRVLLLITGASFLFALHDTLFKKVALTEHFWVSVFWQYVSLTLAGVLVFLVVPRFRRDFISLFKGMRGRIFSLNIMSEVLYIAGNLTNNFAMLLAPVALVLVVSSYQPLFVFVGGILITMFLPHIGVEKITFKHMMHKLASISIILAGSYLLYSSSV